MTFSVPPGTFTMGTTDSKMDMALDDIIKERSKAPESGTSSSRPARRQNIKTRRTQRATSFDKSIGRHKAKQQAAVNARRGLRSSAKPTKKEIDKEVSRQKSKSPLKKSEGAMRGGKGGGPAKRGKAKRGEAAQPPNRKAVAAARRAMAEAGFHAPPGMKMVVSFEPRSPIGTASQTKKKGPNPKTKGRGGPKK